MTLKATLSVHQKHTEALADILLSMSGEDVEFENNSSAEEPISVLQFGGLCSIKEVTPLLHLVRTKGISYSFKWNDSENNLIHGESHYRKDQEGIEVEKEWIGSAKNVVRIEDVRRTLTEDGEIGLNELLDSIEDSYDVLEWTKVAI